MFYSNVSKTILFFLLPVCFLIAACDQSSVAEKTNTDLLYYYMTGGIAGYNLELRIDKNGVITGYNRIKAFSIKSGADASSIIKALDKVDSVYFSAKKPEVPGCCDQIYLIVQYKGLYLDTEKMPHDMYLEIDKAISSFIAPYNQD